MTQNDVIRAVDRLKKIARECCLKTNRDAFFEHIKQVYSLFYKHKKKRSLKSFKKILHQSFPPKPSLRNNQILYTLLRETSIASPKMISRRYRVLRCAAIMKMSPEEMINKIKSAGGLPGFIEKYCKKKRHSRSSSRKAKIAKKGSSQRRSSAPSTSTVSEDEW